MELLNKLGIKTNNINLYETAFTHTSFANEEGVESYERLEYLGDAVLELVMSEYLYLKLNLDEGEMTKIRAHYVCEVALNEYSTRLGLNEYLKLGHGEESSGGKYRRAITADIYEAFIGALFLDQGIEVAKRFIHESAIKILESEELSFFDDYKSELQELIQTDKRSLEYVIIDEQGPAHNKEFTAIVKIDNVIYGKGIAHSKKEAEQAAAKSALEKSVKGELNDQDI